MEGVWEEIWKEASLGVPNPRYVGNHAQGGSVTDGSDHGIQLEIGEPGPIGFGTDPLVA